MNVSRIRTTVLLVALLCLAGFPASVAESVSAETATSGKPLLVKSDFQRLEGRWVRPDGGYMLELKGVKPDGSLTAAYYNPSPIRVFRAEAVKKNGKITLTVELRDVNYPGSIYTLIYDANSDRLRGKYFQAVEKRTFTIEFLRAK